MNRPALLLSIAFALSALPFAAQTPAPPADPWGPLNFLQGTWQAKTGDGAAAKVSGTYTFATELKGHVLARHSTTAGCAGPETFDCEHGDLLYIFQDRPGQPLNAIYFDNEGHVIHYALSTPDATTAVFLSEPGPGPRFRLVYHLQLAVMSGKFQMQMPGQADWKSYLEWERDKAVSHQRRRTLHRISEVDVPTKPSRPRRRAAPHASATIQSGCSWSGRTRCGF